jgi:hypothetical protein
MTVGPVLEHLVPPPDVTSLPTLTSLRKGRKTWLDSSPVDFSSLYVTIASATGNCSGLLKRTRVVVLKLALPLIHSSIGRQLNGFNVDWKNKWPEPEAGSSNFFRSVITQSSVTTLRMTFSQLVKRLCWSSD